MSKELELMIEGLIFIMVFTILVEAITQTLKNLIVTLGSYEDNHKMHKKVLVIMSLVVGIAMSLLFSQDLLAIYGFEAGHPAVGQLFTGILVGRGAGPMHDLYKKIKAVVKPPGP